MPVETVRGDPTAWIRQHNFQSAAIPTNASAAPDPGGTHPLVMASRVYLLHAKKQGRRKAYPVQSRRAWRRFTVDEIEQYIAAKKSLTTPTRPVSPTAQPPDMTNLL
jgi:hypothetical protein